MKKRLALLLCLIMMLSLISCTVQNDGNELPHTNSDTENNESDVLKSTNCYPVTEEQAWSLANTYWDYQNGSKDYGAGTIWSAKIVVSDTPSSDDKYYKVDFLIEWISNGGDDGDDGTTPYAVHSEDRILINAFTGEITTPACEAGNKCISVEEAIEAAKNHRTYMSGHICNEENGYRVEHVPHATAPAHYYVIMIQKYDTVTDVIWIDKYTGKAISPYYVNGKG